MTNSETPKEISLVELGEIHFEVQGIGVLQDLMEVLKIFSHSSTQQDEDDLSLIWAICSLEPGQKAKDPGKKNLTKKTHPLLISWKESKYRFLIFSLIHQYQ